MTRIIKLWDERDLICRLKNDTLLLIHASKTIQPIKKLVEASDILDLTLSINERFPTNPPDLPICDEAALLRLKQISAELYVYHRQEVPPDHLILFDDKVRTLLAVYRLPRHEQQY